VLQLSNAGGRIIIASDGVWDDLTCEMSLDYSRGFPSDIAANRIVNVTNHNVFDKSQQFGFSVSDIFIFLLFRKQSDLAE
jgi:hypothetical protein